MTLFVDCDQTLLLWVSPTDDNEGVEINRPLVDAVNEYIDRTGDQLVVWSGGGQWYAEKWAERCFPNRELIALAKYNPAVSVDDLCIDDMPLTVKGKVITPEQAIATLNS